MQVVFLALEKSSQLILKNNSRRRNYYAVHRYFVATQRDGNSQMYPSQMKKNDSLR